MKVDLFKKPAVILRNFVKLALISLIYVLFSLQSHAQSSLLDSSGSQNAFGVTPLMSAVIDQDISGVKFFARAQADYLNKKNIGGASALHLAARVGNLEIIKLLVENGAKINIKDNEGWTPLMRSVISSNVDVISYLLTKEADATILNSSSESVIYHAASVSCSACLQELLSKYDFESKMKERTLKSQINKSFELARNKEDQKTQDILSAYLELIAKNKEIAAQKAKEELEAKKAEAARIAAEEKAAKEAQEAAKKAEIEAAQKAEKEKKYNFLKPQLAPVPQTAKIAEEIAKPQEEVKEEKIVEQKPQENKAEVVKEEIEEKVEQEPKEIDYKAQAPKKVKRFIILKGEDKKVDVALDDKIEKVVIMNENNEVINEVETKDIEDEVEVKKKEILFKFNKTKEDSPNLVEIEETQIVKESELEAPIKKKKKFSLKKAQEEEKPVQKEEQKKEEVKEVEVKEVEEKEKKEETIIIEKQFENDEFFEEPELFINENDLVIIDEKVEEESTPKSSKIFRFHKASEESVNKESEEKEVKSSPKIKKRKFIFKKSKNYLTPEKIEEDYNNNSDLEEEDEFSAKDEDYSSNSSEKRYYFIPSR